jgi:hypothetical protein
VELNATPLVVRAKETCTNSSTKMQEIKYNGDMKHIGQQLRKNARKSRETERGELMRYFVGKLNVTRVRDGYGKMTMAHMGKLFEKIPTKDLYYLKRVCGDAASFSKKFWWEIDPKKHAEE